MRLSILYIISLFLFLCSCSSEELLQEEDMQQPIRFTSQYLQLGTKVPGVITDNRLPEGAAISIFALQHPINEPLGSWSPSLFNNTPGTADSQGNILYDDTYYFPTGEQLDFFALYPSISEIGSNYYNRKTIDVELPANTADQYDLMYASLLNESKKSSPLVFEFNHLLSQITFHIVKGQNITIDLPLTKIELIAPQRAQLNLWKGNLNIYTDELTTYTLSTDTPIENDTPIPGQFLVFPEKATEFILTFGYDNTHVYHITPSEEPYRWEAGTNYQYNIIINKDITDPILPPVDVPSTPSDTTTVTPPAEETTPPVDSIPTEDPGTIDTPTDHPTDNSTTDTGSGQETVPNEPTDTPQPDANTDADTSTLPDTTDPGTETKASVTSGKPGAPGTIIIRLSLN